MISKIITSVLALVLPKAAEKVVEEFFDSKSKKVKKYCLYKFTPAERESIKHLHEVWKKTGKVKNIKADGFIEFTSEINSIFNTDKVPASIRRVIKSND
jgi:hypothetical protein